MQSMVIAMFSFVGLLILFLLYLIINSLLPKTKKTEPRSAKPASSSGSREAERSYRRRERPQTRRTAEQPLPARRQQAPQKAVPTPAPVHGEVDRVLQKSYPEFDNTRSIEEFGMSQEEAKIFVDELVNQIDTSMTELKTALENKNVGLIEEITHSLKGSATNLAKGGIVDLLVDFNTYAKHASNLKVIAAYTKRLQLMLAEMKTRSAMVA